MRTRAPDKAASRRRHQGLRIADRLGGKVHLDIVESGTFDELRELVSSLKPHAVHLCGHGDMKDGVGHFAFEDERGRTNAHDGRKMAERLFARSGVRLVFVSGCQSARAGAAGLCQRLTVAGHVPLALGWGASIADDRATDFARSLYHDLASGQPVDRAVAAARRELLERGRMRINGAERLDASFALPQLYAAEAADELVDEHREHARPQRPGIRYELLGDNIRGLREGFVGRRRVLQRTHPALQTGEKTVLLLTGIGGAGKSTLATRLANRCKQDGWRIVAVQARREEAPQFCLRLTDELATACQRLERETDERLLRDGERPMADRLRLAVEILNEAKILLVLDNLEALMPRPPAPPRWEDPDFAAFFRELTSRLTRQGRAILTCRYLPEGFDAGQLNLAHEHLPDFTEADFFKYLRRHEKVTARIERGELPWNLLTMFHHKLGGTPRFVEQASVVLATTDPDRLLEQLEGVAETSEGRQGDELWELQQRYFSDLFLPDLYEALPPPYRSALSQLALLDVPIPLDGVTSIAGSSVADVRDAASQWLGLGLVQRFAEQDEVPLYGVYLLQREFLTQPGRLPEARAREAHGAAAAFFQESYEKDREEDLRLRIAVELLACMRHAHAAGDTERRRWAAIHLSRQMQHRAEFQAALELLEPLLGDERHHSVLVDTANALESLGEWKEARAATPRRCPCSSPSTAATAAR